MLNRINIRKQAKKNNRITDYNSTVKEGLIQIKKYITTYFGNFSVSLKVF
jgi:hypothetical protein